MKIFCLSSQRLILFGKWFFKGLFESCEKETCLVGDVAGQLHEGVSLYCGGLLCFQTLQTEIKRKKRRIKAKQEKKKKKKKKVNNENFFAGTYDDSAVPMNKSEMADLVSPSAPEEEEEEEAAGAGAIPGTWGTFLDKVASN